MTSKTSSAKRNVPLRIFLWGLRKNSVLLLISTILAFLASPGFLLAAYFRFLEQKSIYSQVQSFYAESYTLVGEVLLAVGAMGLVLLFTAMNQQHLHSKKAADLWGALPITHGGLVLTRALTVLASTAIPVTISYLGQLTVSVLLPEIGVGWHTVLCSYGFLLLFMLICTGMATLFAVACGNTFDMIASLLVVNAGWPAIVAIFKSQASALLTGYVSGSNMETFFLLSPFSRAVSHPFFPLEPMEAAVHYTLWGLFGLLMLLAAYLLCRVRKNECSGSSYAYGALPVLCQCIIGIGAGFVLSLTFTLGGIFTGDDKPNIVFYLFFVVGTLLGTILYGAIAHRGFKTLLRSLLAGVVVSALSLGAVTAMTVGGFGFETRLPSERLIQSVSLDAGYLSDYKEITLTDPKDIHAAYVLHSKIVEDIQSGQYWTDLSESAELSTLEETSVSPYLSSYEITYTLSSGPTMARKYQLSESRYGNELRQLLASADFLKGTEPILQIRDSDLENHGFSLFSRQSGSIELTFEEVSALAAAYRRDLETVTPESYLFSAEITIQAYPFGNEITELSSGILMRIKANYSESMAYLNTSGILKRLEKSNDDFYIEEYTDADGVHFIS